METVTVRVYYDFASTLCYVAHRVLTSIEEQIAELEVELEWRPIDLTMAAPWDRGDSFSEEVRTAVRNTGLALGLDVEMPDPWLDSRPAAHVALATPTLEAERRWRRAVFDTIFEHGTPTLTPQLLALAEELVGPLPLPGDAQYPRVEKSTLDAVALGVSGVPTLLLDNWLVAGVFDGESMLSILAKLAEQYRELGDSTVN